MKNYYVWLGDTEDDGHAWLTPYRMPALDSAEFRLDEGELCGGWFPQDFVVPLDPARGKRLSNCIPNLRSWAVVDEAARGILEARTKAGSIEYLPIRIEDLRGELVDRSYWIANVLPVVDCADMSRSELRMSSISKGRIAKVARLVLEEAKLPDDAPIFRLANMQNLILVREDLARAFVQSDMTGVMFIDLEHYGAEFRK